MRQTFLPAVLIFLACAPSDNPTGVPASVVRDSAGIQIVENLAASWMAGQEWQVDTAPSVVIRNTAEGDRRFSLTRVNGARRLADGRYIVAASQSQEVILFDREGQFVRKIGRIGEGPGEYQRLEQVVLLGDSIMVSSGGGYFGPTNFFDSTGKVLLTLPGAPDTLRKAVGEGRFWESRDFLPDGSFVVHVTTSDSAYRTLPTGATYRPPQGFYRINRNGRVDSIGWYTGIVQRKRAPADDATLGFYSRVFVRSHLAAGGTPLQIYATTDDLPDVDVYDSTGKRVRIIRRMSPAEAMTAKVAASMDSGYVARVARTPEEKAKLEAALKNLPPASEEFYPRTEDLKVDSEGYLWQAVGGTAGGWYVHDPNGRLLGRVTMPRRGRLLAIGKDYIVVMMIDEDGLESVAEYGLRREVKDGNR